MKNQNQLKNLIWIVPAIIAFFIALIPTLKYQWPLSWDIIYHIQYAMIYAKYGFVLTDPLLNAPLGQKIGYPPLFHFLIASLGLLTKIDFFQIARALQPFLAMFIVLSVSFVARKFYGLIAGVSAGFLILSSFLVGRIILPIPENLALIFLPLAIYFYYASLKYDKLKYAFIAGLIFIIVILTHQAAALILFLIITSFSVVELILYRNIRVFKNYGAFILLLASLIVLGLIALLLWYPNIIHSIFNQGLSAATGFLTSISSNRPMDVWGYLGFLGYLVLIFTIIGGYFAFIKRRKKDILIFTWVIVVFLLSISYLFGINVISYRLLVYMLIPLSILGGFGISQTYNQLKNYKSFSSPEFRSIFLLAIFTLATFTGILTVENPAIATFQVKNQFGAVQIAPPSSSDVDLANWFNEHGDRNKSIITNNLFTGTFLATKSGMPLHYGFEDVRSDMSIPDFKQSGIGYIVLDKRLTFKSVNGTLYKKIVRAEFYPLVYFSEDIRSNIDEIVPSYIKVVYENQDYIVLEVPN